MITTIKTIATSFGFFWDRNIKLRGCEGEKFHAHTLPETSILRLFNPHTNETKYYLVVRPNWVTYKERVLELGAEAIFETTQEHYWQHMPAATIQLSGGRVGYVGAF